MLNSPYYKLAHREFYFLSFNFNHLVYKYYGYN